MQRVKSFSEYSLSEKNRGKKAKSSDGSVENIHNIVQGSLRDWRTDSYRSQSSRRESDVSEGSEGTDLNDELLKNIRGDADDAEGAKRLIEMGANIAEIDSKLSTGLGVIHIATIKKKPKTIQVLIDAGADVNASSDGEFTPLWLATTGMRASDLDREIVAVLTRAGGDIMKAGLSIEKLYDYFRGDISPIQGKSAEKLRRMKRSKQAFGM